ncbi:Flp pilus assembly protein CpaB [Aestuariispira ectoiniformans]|uniref:Flp pilus assembly protein CpaB n=1 Tax=Aestuariispira ectoiniformans TaxID=2775080 RepID=UPI00223B84AB|nr:Flp pilus assembly protein CpaB [Aestuariispira ectoiniformans]
MSIRSVLLILVAVMMAGGTAFYARNLIVAERNAAEAVQKEAVVEAVKPAERMVLVASKAVSIGKFIKPEDLEWTAWPEDGVLDNYVAMTPDDLAKGESDEEGRASFAGAVARQTIQAGQPVMRSQFVFPGDKGFLAAVLEPGHRAMTVPIDATKGIAGFVFPGDHVDLILALRLKGKDLDGKDTTRYASLTLDQDIRVLAIDQNVTNEEGEVVVAKTATLEVLPKQAERIALSLSMGSLSLSLRGLPEQNTNLADASDNAFDAFMKGKTDKKDRNYTIDLEVFSVNGHDLSLNSGGRRKATPTQKAHTVTVLRGSPGGSGGLGTK